MNENYTVLCPTCNEPLTEVSRQDPARRGEVGCALNICPNNHKVNIPYYPFQELLSIDESKIRLWDDGFIEIVPIDDDDA